MKRRHGSNVLFWAVYGGFTVLCIVFGCVTGHTSAAWMLWYAGTIAAWVITALQMLALLTRLRRIRREKQTLLRSCKRKDDPS